MESVVAGRYDEDIVNAFLVVYIKIMMWNRVPSGTNTTRRSEGVNSFFDGFVTPTTNLREFVVKYEQALKRIMDRESDEDFESEHKYRMVNEGEFLLKHAAKFYTRNIFNKFKDEWKGMCECQNFEFVGILYQHLLKIFVRLDIDTLPDHQGEALVAMVIIGLVISVYVALHRQII
ncbi:hypothetical protein L3X38_026058 [Prunus dulcis]|uniref:Protein FAR1-RELATED SEQUENCE n=1 Tax=Prunus dulcis TaxID=3755 RepID=A0AAD4W2Y0_PRUDU|nr:hypothetical protein L3X38_026058 [Prunus dulcis]